MSSFDAPDYTSFTPPSFVTKDKPPSPTVASLVIAIISMLIGIAATIIAVLSYVDLQTPHASVYSSVKVASPGPLITKSVSEGDGVKVGGGDRVLVKDEINSQWNGIYVWNTGGYQRASDMSSHEQITPSLSVYVEQGTVNGGASFSVFFSTKKSASPDPVTGDGLVYVNTNLLDLGITQQNPDQGTLVSYDNQQASQLKWVHPSDIAVTSLSAAFGLVTSSGGAIKSQGSIQLAPIASYSFIANNTSTASRAPTDVVTMSPNSLLSMNQSSGLYAFPGPTATHQYLSCDSNLNLSWVNASSSLVSITAGSSGIVVSPSPITGTGTISIQPLAAFSVWGNNSGASAVPQAISLVPGAILGGASSTSLVLAPPSSGSGQVLSFAGAGVGLSWNSVVTSLTAGTGLTGGTITNTGTIALAVAANALIGGSSNGAQAVSIPLGTGALITNNGSGLAPLNPGSSGFFLQSAGPTSALTWASAITNILGTTNQIAVTLNSNTATISLYAISNCSILANNSGTSSSPSSYTINRGAILTGTGSPTSMTNLAAPSSIGALLGVAAGPELSWTASPTAVNSILYVSSLTVGNGLTWSNSSTTNGSVFTIVSGVPAWAALPTSVASVSITTANGLQGTVTGTTTLAVTLALDGTFSGLLKTSGTGHTGITGATAGTDYMPGTASLGTGILKTVNGALSLATANDLTGTVAIANGGTGQSSLAPATPNALLFSTSTTATAFTAGTSVAGLVMTSNGSGAPSWQALSVSAVTAITVGAGLSTPVSGGVITSTGTINLANFGSAGLMGATSASGGTPSNIAAIRGGIYAGTGSPVSVEVFSPPNSNAVGALLTLASGPELTWLPLGANGTYLSSNGSALSWSTSPIVNSISVASANGFSGVSSGGTSPALTLTIGASGMLKGTSGSIASAVAGTDYVVPTVTSLPALTGVSSTLSGLIKSSSGTLSAAVPNTDFVTPAVTALGSLVSISGSLSTGLLKCTTITGALTTAVAGTDYVTPSVSSLPLTNLAGSIGTGMLKITSSTGALTLGVAGTDYVIPAVSSLPSLTSLSTSLTGVLKASAGVLSQAVAGTDYVVPGVTTLASLTTISSLGSGGIVKIASGGTLSLAQSGTDYCAAVGSTSVVTLGVVATGTWNATPVSLLFGGSGQSQNAPSIGSFLVSTSTTATAWLQGGTAGTFLMSNGLGSAPTWGNPTISGTLAITSGGTGQNTNPPAEGALLYANTTSTQTWTNTPTSGQFLSVVSNVPTWTSLTYLGSLTVANANGFAGSVATNNSAATLTVKLYNNPAGMLKGDGAGGVTIASAPVDYLAGTVAIANGGTGQTASPPTGQGAFLYAASSQSSTVWSNSATANYVMIANGSAVPTWTASPFVQSLSFNSAGGIQGTYSGLNPATIALTLVSSLTSLLKSTGNGVIQNAVAGVDYIAGPSVAIANGGTGQTGAGVVNGILYGTSTTATTWTNSSTTAGQVLTIVSGVPAWSSPQTVSNITAVSPLVTSPSGGITSTGSIGINQYSSSGLLACTTSGGGAFGNLHIPVGGIVTGTGTSGSESITVLSPSTPGYYLSVSSSQNLLWQEPISFLNKMTTVNPSSGSAVYQILNTDTTLLCTTLYYSPILTLPSNPNSNQTYMIADASNSAHQKPIYLVPQTQQVINGNNGPYSTVLATSSSSSAIFQLFTGLRNNSCVFVTEFGSEMYLAIADFVTMNISTLDLGTTTIPRVAMTPCGNYIHVYHSEIPAIRVYSPPTYINVSQTFYDHSGYTPPAAVQDLIICQVDGGNVFWLIHGNLTFSIGQYANCVATSVPTIVSTETLTNSASGTWTTYRAAFSVSGYFGIIMGYQFNSSTNTNYYQAWPLTKANTTTPVALTSTVTTGVETIDSGVESVVMNDVNAFFVVIPVVNHFYCILNCMSSAAYQTIATTGTVQSLQLSKDGNSLMVLTSSNFFVYGNAQTGTLPTLLSSTTLSVTVSFGMGSAFVSGPPGSEMYIYADQSGSLNQILNPVPISLDTRNGNHFMTQVAPSNWNLTPFYPGPPCVLLSVSPVTLTSITSSNSPLLISTFSGFTPSYGGQWRIEVDYHLFFSANGGCTPIAYATISDVIGHVSETFAVSTAGSSSTVGDGMAKSGKSQTTFFSYTPITCSLWFSTNINTVTLQENNQASTIPGVVPNFKIFAILAS